MEAFGFLGPNVDELAIWGCLVDYLESSVARICRRIIAPSPRGTKWPSVESAFCCFIALDFSPLIHTCVGVDWAGAFIPVRRDVDVCPVSAPPLGCRVELMVHHERFAEARIDCGPVRFQIFEVDIFDKVFDAWVMLERPFDDLDRLQHRFSVFAFEAWPWITFLARRSVVVGTVWKKSQHGEIIAHGPSADEH